MLIELMMWFYVFLGNDVDWKQVLLIGMMLVFLIVFVVEYVVMIWCGCCELFCWKEIVVNLLFGVGYQVVEIVMGLLLIGVIFVWVY